jgi:hypothetical protein
MDTQNPESTCKRSPAELPLKLVLLPLAFVLGCGVEAGEQGRGPTAVVTELRRLAQRTSAADKVIKGLTDTAGSWSVHWRKTNVAVRVFLT